MSYVDGSGELTPGESTTLDGLSTGAVPVKTTMGFTAATQDNIPGGTTYKPYNPAAAAITGGTIGGAAVGPPTVVGVAQLTAGVYAVQASDSHLQVTATASVAAEIDLRAGSSGAQLTVTNSGGDPATAYQVTVVPNGADTILGSTGITIDGRESYTLAYNTATTDWEVL